MQSASSKLPLAFGILLEKVILFAFYKLIYKCSIISQVLSRYFGVFNKQKYDND